MFCLKYLEIGNATEAAILAGYSPKTARFSASRLLTRDNIKARYSELQQIAQGATIATVTERKQVLTEIVRGRFIDFMTNLTPEKLRSAALQEIRIVEAKVKGKQDTPIVKKTTIRLHSPIQAIAELNKMEGIYEAGVSISIDNRTLVIEELSDEQLIRIIAREGSTRVIEAAKGS